jgi:hypothetical protein
MRIAILGAPATGKTSLANALAQHLNQLHISDAPSLDALRSPPYDRILLTGLDLPGITPQQQQVDAALRAALQAQGLQYSVVYGEGTQRLRAAMRLITPPRDTPAPRWRGTCDCADPDCEFRLFTGLTRSTAADHPPA